MKIVPMKLLLERARREGYAVPAFNVCSMENIQAVLAAAGELAAPLIVQAHFLESGYAGEKNLVEMVRNCRVQPGVDVAVHLDHGASLADVVKCIRGGFTSVMFDGSQLPLEENIRLLRQVVKIAHMVGVTVEGEIGTIGQTSEMGERLECVGLTDPAAAERLAEETGVDCLAVAIGNAHGFYSGPPKLDLERLEEIARRVPVPLVLHGGTGIPEDQVRQAIALGIAKVNVSTALRSAYIGALRDHLARQPGELSFMDLSKEAIEAMKGAAKSSIRRCMAEGRCLSVDDAFKGSIV